MATRLYFHAATSTVSGTLPSTEQSSRTSAQNVDAQTVNRSMNTSIGTAQTSVTGTSANATDRIVYITKFISQPLVTTSISANTWTLNFAYKIANSTNQTAPVREATGNPKYNVMPLTCYVWRPSTGAKVGNIIDADSAGTSGEFHDCSQTGTSELVEQGTFSGSAVTATAGDVIVLEAWIYSTDSTARANAINWYYDGTTANTTNESVVSNHASFLESPQAITFSTGSNNIAKTLTETVTIGATVPTKLKGSKRTATETIAISSTPTTLAAKKRSPLNPETVTISTDPGSPSFIKAKNTNKSLTETVTISSTPTFKRNKVRAITSTVTINTPTPTYIQVPKRARVNLTETVTIASTVVRKNSKNRSLLN